MKRNYTCTNGKKRGKCRMCSCQVLGAKSKGGPPNEAWRVSMNPRRKQTA